MTAADQINQTWAEAENCRSAALAAAPDIAMVYATQAVSLEIRALAIFVSALVVGQLEDE